MKGIRNITVAVSDDLYRQTRRVAAEYDTTVTEMVRFLLIALPSAVEAALFPGGRPQFGRAVYLAKKAGTPWPPSAQSQPPIPTPQSPQTAATEITKNTVCIPVNPPQQTDSKSTYTESTSENTAQVSQYPSPNPSAFNNFPIQPETRTAPVSQ
jgi:hypothetical protein